MRVTLDLSLEAAKILWHTVNSKTDSFPNSVILKNLSEYIDQRILTAEYGPSIVIKEVEAP